jgi:triosephosphate isomerase
VSPIELESLVKQVVQQVLQRLDRSAPSWDQGPPFGPSPPLVAANWKMNIPRVAGASSSIDNSNGGPVGALQATRAMLAAYIEALREAPLAAVDGVVFPPSTLLSMLAEQAATGGVELELGAQDVHPAAAGAHTGELSTGLIRAAGGRWVLVGHSERRAAGEDEDQVQKKLAAALAAKLGAILCVGENRSERNSGATFRVLRMQLQAALANLALTPPEPRRLAVAYEPIWAIGSGEKATRKQIEETGQFVRQVLCEVFGYSRGRCIRVLYGGSVKPENAAEVFAIPAVDGVLVGGASLAGDGFARIVAAGASVAAHRAANGRK